MDNLSAAEKKYYESVYRKIYEYDEKVNKNTCLKLFQRAVPNPEICEQVWKISKGHSGDDILTKAEFFKAMKYLAALQYGYTLEKIDFNQLPPLQNPSFPKRNSAGGSESKLEESKKSDSLSMSRLLQSANKLAIIPEERMEDSTEKKSKVSQLNQADKQSDGPTLSDSIMLHMTPKKDYRPALSNTSTLASSAILNNPFKSTAKEPDFNKNDNNLILETNEQESLRSEKLKGKEKKQIPFENYQPYQNGAIKNIEQGRVTYQE